jgi:DNA-binding transcriptional LysR family regulator
MEIRQLEYFEAVSRLNSFTKAAKEHHVAQPSITVSIRKLEEELGISLFERSNNRIKLTLQGQLFLERANAILTEVKGAQQLVKDIRQDKKQNLRLGIPPFLGSWILPIIFTHYVKQHPDVELVVQDLGTHEIIDELLKDNIDLGLVVLDDSLSMLESLLVSEGELLLLLPKGHPFEAVSEVPFEWLEQEKLIMYKPSTFISTRIMQEFTKHSITPNIIHSPNQLATILNLVVCGAGISFVLDDSNPLIKDSPNLVTRPLKSPISYRAGLVWKENKYLIDSVRDFLKFFKS